MQSLCTNFSIYATDSVFDYSSSNLVGRADIRLHSCVMIDCLEKKIIEDKLMNANCTSALKWFTKKKTELKKFKEKIYSYWNIPSRMVFQIHVTTRHNTHNKHNNKKTYTHHHHQTSLLCTNALCQHFIIFKDYIMR